MFRRRGSNGDQVSGQVLEHVSSGLHGGKAAAVVSAFALLFSGFSFYESSMRNAELSIYVPPQIQYADPDSPDSPFEVFAVPVTFVNDGARTGAVTAIDFFVTNLRSGETKTFYAANVGTWGTTPLAAFTPISLPGKESYSTTVQFFPREGEAVPRILDLEPGQYRFKLVLHGAQARTSKFFEQDVMPLEFEMQAGQMDYRFFNNDGTMGLRSADYRPAGVKP
jgi:hypothetical protein